MSPDSMWTVTPPWYFPERVAFFWPVWSPAPTSNGTPRKLIDDAVTVTVIVSSFVAMNPGIAAVTSVTPAAIPLNATPPVGRLNGDEI